MRSWLRHLSRFAVMVVLLAACAPHMAPAGSAAGQAAISESVFTTDDGLSLPMRRWLPLDGTPRAVVLAVHGFNDYSKAFDVAPDAPGVGPTLAAQGIAVYAYDQRGFGRAPFHGLWAGSDALIGDFQTFARMLRARHPGVPLYALGESMGGAVVIAALADSPPDLVDGAILAAPAVWARSTMPIPYRLALWVGVHIVPGFKPSARGLGFQASDNIAMLQDASRDPLFIKATRIDALYGLANLMDEALEKVGSVTPRTLYLYGAKDEIVPKRPTLRALERMAGANLRPQVAFYPEGWHMLLRDKQAERVLTDIVAFIDHPDTPLPSGADDGAFARLQDAVDR